MFFDVTILTDFISFVIVIVIVIWVCVLYFWFLIGGYLGFFGLCLVLFRSGLSGCYYIFCDLFEIL